jgi:phospholipid/cholesterol/gamma-HCH transport system ATP-binding protein
LGGKPILRGIDLDIRAGETMVLLGGSGEGKSVMLRHLNGLLRPDRGEVVVDGVDLTSLREDAFRPIRLKVAMVFQGGALFDSLNVYQNIAYPLREHTTMSETRMCERVSELLAMVELSGIERLYPAELSGGMRKRVALARDRARTTRGTLRRADNRSRSNHYAQDQHAHPLVSGSPWFHFGGCHARH